LESNAKEAQSLRHEIGVAPEDPAMLLERD